MPTDETIIIADAGPVQAGSGAGRTQLTVTGMSCGHCVQSVTQALQRVPGVANAEVELEGQQATVRWRNPREQNLTALIQAVEQAGFSATVVEAQTTTSPDHGQHKLAGWQLNL